MITSTRSLFLTFAACSAATFFSQSARAVVPGTPNGGATGLLNLFEPFTEFPEFTNRDISATFPNGVCDGYLVMGKEPIGGPPNTCATCSFPGTASHDPLSDALAASCSSPTWSDVVVFWDGVNLPTGACSAAVHFMALLSRRDEFRRNVCEAASDFPAAGLLPVATTAPAALQGLTVAAVVAGAGANASVWQRETLLGRNDLVRYTAGGGTYTIFSDVPALPSWGFALLGGALLGTGLLLFRRGRSSLILA